MVFFPGGGWRVGIDHPTPFSAKVEEKVDLYLYIFSGASLAFFWGAKFTCLYNSPLCFEDLLLVRIVECMLNVCISVLTSCRGG